MGVIIRQSIKSSIVSYAGVLIGFFNVVFLTTHFFSPKQVGISRVLIENALLFTSLAQLGGPFIAVKYFSRFKNHERKHHGLLYFLLMYSSIGVIIFIFIYIFSKQLFVHFYAANSPELIEFYYYILPLVFFSIYLNIFEAYCQVNERIVVPTIVREIFLKLSNSVLILLFAINVITFNSYLLFLIATSGIASVILLIYLKKLGKLFLKKDFSLLKKSFVREMTVYGLFIVLGGLGYILATKIDVLMLPAMINLQSTGIYVIAIYIATIIEIPKRSISQIATPILAQALHENNIDKVDELYKKTSINQLIIGCVFFLAIWCNIDSIFTIMPNSAIYSQGKYVVFFILLARLIDMASGVNFEIILNSKYFRFGLTSIVILSLLTIGTNLIFIPVFGINGAAFAASLSILIYTIIKLIYVWIKFRLQPYSQKTGIVLIIAAIIYGILQLLPVMSVNIYGNIAFILIKSLIISVLFLFFVLRFAVSEDITNLLNIFLKRIKK